MMGSIGILFIVVILQIGVSFAGARRFAGRGLGIALLPALAVPTAILALTIGLALGPDGLSEGFARAAVFLAAALIVLLVIGLIAAAIAIMQSK
jgi:hypothetical protein